LCQPVNNGNQSVDNEGVYGVLPYMAPEILRGCRFTKAADIYSFGIIMNEYLSEGIPYGNIPHDHVLAIKICKGIRPKISEDTPKLLTELIIKCWDVNAENRPTAREIRQILKKWNDESYNKSSEIYSQINECEKIRIDKLKNNSSKNKPIIKTHPQATYTSRLLNFKNLPEPVNFSFNLGNSFNLYLNLFIMKILFTLLKNLIDPALSTSTNSTSTNPIIINSSKFVIYHLYIL